MQLDLGEWLGEMVASTLKGTPEEGPEEWAPKNIFLGAKETPKPGFYDLAETPWARRAMEVAMDENVREFVAMKCSRSGLTEGVLNVIRWKPGHAPGPCLYSINSAPKAKEVMEKRIEPHLIQLYPELRTGNLDDETNAFFKLTNMDVQVSGSGAAGPFMEGWFDLIVLDEYEEHCVDHEDSTADRARGRQITVDNPILYIICKPQLENGPIHREYLRGTQEKYHIPCPHCGQLQELVWDFVRFDHCKDMLGDYDMDRVLAETYYECRHCHEKIEEHHKRAMINDPRVEWVPAAEEDRNAVKAEAGVVSIHISDLYSLHSTVSWGNLAQKFLNAFVTNPTITAKKWFWTNHLGKPWETRKATMRRKDLDMLMGGFIEHRAGGVRRVLGKKFLWAFRDGKQVAPLPIDPAFISMTVDKQGSELKGVIFFWNKEWEAWPVEYFSVPHEDDVVRILQDRRYKMKDGTVRSINTALIDAHYKPHEVYRACFKVPGIMFPSMGMKGTDAFRGRHLKTREDIFEGRHVFIYDYFNHAVESDFYLSKIKERSEPRLWLPADLGDDVGRELCSSKLIVKNGREFWSKDNETPNDYGDCFKMQYVVREIVLQEVGGL